jgi:hypothetical protein
MKVEIRTASADIDIVHDGQTRHVVAGETLPFPLAYAEPAQPLTDRRARRRHPRG